MTTRKVEECSSPLAGMFCCIFKCEVEREGETKRKERKRERELYTLKYPALWTENPNDSWITHM